MAYINAQNTKQIREALKKRFPNLKFSVTTEHYSSISVCIMAGDLDFSQALAYVDKYDGTVQEFKGYRQINQYYLENYGEFEPLFTEIMDIIKNGSDRKWFDESDAMTDYFHTAFYIHLNVGKWNKPYIYNQLKKAA